MDSKNRFHQIVAGLNEKFLDYGLQFMIRDKPGYTEPKQAPKQTWRQRLFSAALVGIFMYFLEQNFQFKWSFHSLKFALLMTGMLFLESTILQQTRWKEHIKLYWVLGLIGAAAGIWAWYYPLDTPRHRVYFPGGWYWGSLAFLTAGGAVILLLAGAAVMCLLDLWEKWKQTPRTTV